MFVREGLKTFHPLRLLLDLEHKFGRLEDSLH